MNSADFKLSRIVQTSLLQGLSIFGVVLMAVMVAIGVSVGDALKI